MSNHKCKFQMDAAQYLQMNAHVSRKHFEGYLLAHVVYLRVVLPTLAETLHTKRGLDGIQFRGSFFCALKTDGTDTSTRICCNSTR